MYLLNKFAHKFCLSEVEEKQLSNDIAPEQSLKMILKTYVILVNFGFFFKISEKFLNCNYIKNKDLAIIYGI